MCAEDKRRDCLSRLLTIELSCDYRSDFCVMLLTLEYDDRRAVRDIIVHPLNFVGIHSDTAVADRITDGGIHKRIGAGVIETGMESVTAAVESDDRTDGVGVVIPAVLFECGFKHAYRCG